jgi:hypothetical protein
MTEKLLDAKESGGILFLTGIDHSTYEVTPPDMFSYFPTNITAMQEQYQAQTTTFILLRTKDIFEQVLWWWYLSLTPNVACTRL